MPDPLPASFSGPPPLIELKGVSKCFDQQRVLDQIDLQIYSGEGLAIIGPSGTGKSTILRLIAGLIAPDEGKIYIQGQLRQGLAAEGKDPIGIGMVFQQAALFDSLTVEENVGFLLYEHSRLPRRRIRELVNEKLEMLGLSGVGDRYPAQLSGGMRKRVSLARAIIANPEDPTEIPGILLYDEPTAGLDPIAATVVEDMIRFLQRQPGGCQTYAIVTHQDSTIRRTADRIVFLYAGKIQWQGTPADIERTDNPYVRQFFSAAVAGPIQVVGA